MYLDFGSFFFLLFFLWAHGTAWHGMIVTFHGMARQGAAQHRLALDGLVTDTGIRRSFGLSVVNSIKSDSVVSLFLFLSFQVFSGQ